MAVDQTGLHALDGIAADRMPRLHQLYSRKFRRLFSASDEILIPGAIVPPRYSTFLRNTAKCSRRTEIDDDQRPAVFGICCYRVDDSVRSHLLRVIIFDDHPGLNSRADFDGSDIEVLDRQMLQSIGNRRNHSGDNRVRTSVISSP